MVVCSHANQKYMSTIKIKTSPAVQQIFENYPDDVQPKMLKLRDLVLKVAEELEDVHDIEETLKWGEPSYIAKKGSTLRMDWKARSPYQLAMYFSCSSQLVPSFKAVYHDLFKFEGNRAIIFEVNERFPENELKRCIAAALRYHKVKNLPLLGL